jgi:hypothetical protein
VTINLLDDKHFYFDFLEAAILSDVPAPLPARANLSPALDYSTDHTYKLSPDRLLWIFENLGYTGPMNEYLGVFWWNQRKRVGAAIPFATVTFSGEFVRGDKVSINIGGQKYDKRILDGDNVAGIVRHFEYLINANSVGVWARANGNVLTVTARSPRFAYSYETFDCDVVRATGSTGSAVKGGKLHGGKEGKWTVDPEQTPALNRGAQEWHKDFFAGCAARNRELVVAGSMELVNPPEGFSAMHPDGDLVATAVGFGDDLKSSHCAFIEPVRKYQTAVFTDVARWMAQAGLVPTIQCGEYVWWFISNRTSGNPDGGMGYYHPEILAAAQSALGRPLHRFEETMDDPLVNNGADAIFLRNRLRDYVSVMRTEVRSAVPGTRFELLFPFDVNYPTKEGVNKWADASIGSSTCRWNGSQRAPVGSISSKPKRSISAPGAATLIFREPQWSSRSRSHGRWIPCVISCRSSDTDTHGKRRSTSQSAPGLALSICGRSITYASSDFHRHRTPPAGL